MIPEDPSSPRVCSSCLQPKASLKSELCCGLCGCLLCKDCAQFLPESAFALAAEIPEALRHPLYCALCHDAQVLPARRSYEETLEKAKAVYVFAKKHHIPLLKRSKDLLAARDCADEAEALLRMAFAAVERGFNAIIEVKIESKKVFVNGYQSLSWSGSAYPALIRPEGLEENRRERGKTPIPLPELVRKKGR